MLNEHARFKEKRLEDSEGIIFYTDTFSFEALSMAKKHQNLWDDRLVLDGRKVCKKSKSSLIFIAPVSSTDRPSKEFCS